MNPNTATGYEATGINTPRQYPKTASDFLQSAASTLGERGQQYDPAGKQERSMTAIVAAFNAIYPIQLTIHMGWQFMSIVKMVRGATNPHIDSALDQVAYAALAAEEVANHLHSQEQLREAYAHNPYVGKAAEEADVKPEPTAAERIEQLLAHNRSLEVQLDTTHSALSDFVCRFDLTKEYMTKEQVLAGQFKHNEQVANLRHTVKEQAETITELREEVAVRQNKLAAQQELLSVAQHNANFYFDKTNSCILANESMTANFQAERKANVAMHEEVARLRGKVQELADLAEYRDKRNAELCADLETQRGKCIAQSSRISELQTLVDNLRSSLEQATKEAPCVHNMDEPKAPRPEYVDPFDQYGDMRSPMHRLVGSLDPARGGLA